MTASIHIELTAQTVEKALQQLIDDIDQIGTSLSKPEENPDNNDPFFDERARIMATVAVVVLFMQSLPELDREERLRPLVTLLEALTDVHEGRNSPLLTPIWNPKGVKIPLGEQFRRASAAAAMEFFTRVDGCSNEEAARLVSLQIISTDAHLFNDRTPPHEQIKSWRDNIMGGTNGDGAQYYRETIASIEVQFPDPEQAAQYLLGR